MRIKTKAWKKKELDKTFSLFLRAKYADVFGSVRCYTCDGKFHWRTIQCGHFNPRSVLATRWDEENCRPQCVGCNVFGRGKLPIFSLKLVRELGKAKFGRLVEKNKLNIYSKSVDIDKLLIKYQKKLDKVLEEKGLEI